MRELKREIESQFPEKCPGEDYQSAFTFAVILDIRDWRTVLRSLEAPRCVDVIGCPQGQPCLQGAPSAIEPKPAGYAVTMDGGWYVGIYRDEETAKLVAPKHPKGAVVPLYYRSDAPVPEELAPSWISVKDRLPDVEQRVLILESGEVAFGQRCHKRGGGYEWRGENFGYDGASEATELVTHWMPEPSPPNMNSGGKS